MALVAAMLGASAAWAQVAGTIVTAEDRKIEGAVKWKAREKAYAITAKGGSVELQIALASVKELQIPKPKELDAAAKNVQEGSAAAAIPALEKIAADYLMLQWDKPATRLLADAYVKSGDAEKAIRACEKVIASDPDAAFLGEMAPSYWQALLKAGRTSKAEDLVTKAIKSGDREASAFALLMRGDLIAASGDSPEVTKRSLRDGYLRVVTLYKSVKAAQPEGLYKTAKCFEKLGQTSRADQWRTTLKGEFGSSEWARKP
jgi:tetratricopeptide (TPR) repeat protein